MTPTTDITTLAADVRREHAAAEQAFASAVEHAICCGALLAEAKAQLPHGSWLPWLEANFPASVRTAQGYMRLAERAEDAQALAHLGVAGALRELAAPPSTREAPLAPPPPEPTQVPDAKARDDARQLSDFVSHLSGSAFALRNGLGINIPAARRVMAEGEARGLARELRQIRHGLGRLIADLETS